MWLGLLGVKGSNYTCRQNRKRQMPRQQICRGKSHDSKRPIITTDFVGILTQNLVIFPKKSKKKSSLIQVLPNWAVLMHDDLFFEKSYFDSKCFNVFNFLMSS